MLALSLITDMVAEKQTAKASPFPVRSSLTLKLMDNHLEKLFLAFSVIPFQRQLKILDACALVKKEEEDLEKICLSRVQYSIELLMVSWLKEVISQEEMAQVANLSTERNLRMKTSRLDIQSLTFSPWRTLVQTLTDPNSSSHLQQLLGLMENIVFSVKFLKVKISSNSSKVSEVKVEKPREESSLAIAEKFEESNEMKDFRKLKGETIVTLFNYISEAILFKVNLNVIKKLYFLLFLH